jgi:hypothetical protein
MTDSDDTIPKRAKAPAVLGAFCFIIYLLFIGSSFYWTGGWVNSLFRDHYVFFVGLPFSGFLAYFIVGTLENVRGNIEFEAIGIKFKGASGPIVMWVLVYISIVLSIKIVWPLT